MSVAVWNCHSWPLDISSSVKLPVLTTRCQHWGDSSSGYFISHLILVSSSDKLWGVYLIAYLATSSHILSWSLHLKVMGGYIWQLIWVLHLKIWSHILSWSLHLTSYGGYIWQLIWVLHLKIWSHILSWSLHLISYRGVYLTAYLHTSSENLDSHLILVTSSDKLKGGVEGGYIWYDCMILTDCLLT